MHVFVVIPCLNEQAHIRATVASLAGDGLSSDDGELVLVDNGSSDGTWYIMGRLADECSSGRIHRVREPQQGYVPARHSGVVHVAKLAEARGWAPEEVLILQADADTLYLSHYIERMRQAATANTLLEGAIGRSRGEDRLPESYRVLERQVDKAMRAYEVADGQETLVDDKACGYRLSDYRVWGGLRREYAGDGSELHAETSRMFLRARALSGAKRRRVDRAGALTSARKVWANPTLNFATAGYPRERSWVASFEGAMRAPDGPLVTLSADAALANESAIRLRVAHALVLFSILPRCVARTLGEEVDEPEWLASVLANRPPSELSDLIERPGRVIADLLAMAEQPGVALEALITQCTAEVLAGAGGPES